MQHVLLCVGRHIANLGLFRHIGCHDNIHLWLKPFNVATLLTSFHLKCWKISLFCRCLFRVVRFFCRLQPVSIMVPGRSKTELFPVVQCGTITCRRWSLNRNVHLLQPTLVSSELCIYVLSMSRCRVILFTAQCPVHRCWHESILHAIYLFKFDTERYLWQKWTWRTKIILCYVESAVFGFAFFGPAFNHFTISISRLFLPWAPMIVQMFK